MVVSAAFCTISYRIFVRLRRVITIAPVLTFFAPHWLENGAYIVFNGIISNEKGHNLTMLLPQYFPNFSEFIFTAKYALNHNGKVLVVSQGWKASKLHCYV